MRTLSATDAYFIVARLWKVLTYQNHFQSGYVGLYPIVLALLPHQLMRLANFKGSPINISGRTAEFRPPDNPHLIVHECSAFGTGEMQAIRNFIQNHESRPASERLHAIW